MEKLEGERIKAEQDAVAKKQAINAAAGETQKRQDESLAKARIEAEQSVSEASIALDKQTTETLAATHRISIGEETAQLKAQSERDYQTKKDALSKELELAKAGGDAQAAEVIRLQGQLNVLETKHQTDLNAIQAAGDAKELEQHKKLLEEQTEADQQASDQRLQLVKTEADTRLSTGRITVRQWAAEERAAVQQWLREQETALSQRLAFAKATYGQDSLEYKTMLDKMVQLQRKASEQEMAIDKKMSESAKQTYGKIQQDFNASVVSVLSGQETIGQGFARLMQQLVSDMASWLLRLAEQQLLYHVITHEGQSKANVSAVTSDAAKAGAAAYASTMAGLPFPANVRCGAGNDG